MKLVSKRNFVGIFSFENTEGLDRHIFSAQYLVGSSASEHPGHNPQRRMQTLKPCLTPWAQRHGTKRRVSWTQKAAIMQCWSYDNATMWQATDITKVKAFNNSFPSLLSWCLPYKSAIYPKQDFIWHVLNPKYEKNLPEWNMWGFWKMQLTSYSLHFPLLNSSEQTYRTTCLHPFVPRASGAPCFVQVLNSTFLL